MTGLILESGIDDNLVQSVTTVLDKKDKLSSEEFNDMLKKIGLINDQIRDLNEYFNFSLNELKEVFVNSLNDKIIIGLEEVDKLSYYLSKLEIDSICKFDITLARGQNYYTGNVFEVYDKEQRVTGSIAAGGRYDKMIGNFIGDDEEYPTVGISFGLSAIYEILKKGNFDNELDNDFYIIPMDTEIESLNIANIIRNNGYSVEIEMNNRKLKKSLDYANKQGIKYVIIVGSDEIKNNELTIKDMDNKNNITININDLKKYDFKNKLYK